MCDVRKSVVRFVMLGLAASVLALGVTTAEAQVKQRRAKRETNASRQARVNRTINGTYSHRWEVFGGGGFLRYRAGQYLKKNSEVSWAANTSYYFNSRWAVVGSAQGSFGNGRAFVNNTYGVENPQINEYFFMGGPSYRFYRKEKVALSAQAQAGVGWGIFDGGSKDIPSPLLGMPPTEFRTAYSLGVSADYNFYPNLAFRVTPTYIGSTFGGFVQNNLGFNAGIVYRFGQR